jgi:hypothetical protein
MMNKKSHIKLNSLMGSSNDVHMLIFTSAILIFFFALDFAVRPLLATDAIVFVDSLLKFTCHEP